MKRISTLVGIVIILTAAIILFGGVSLFQKYFVKNWEIKTPATIQELSNNQAPEEYPDPRKGPLIWKLYTNSQYGFEMQYPSNFYWNGFDNDHQAVRAATCDYQTFLNNCPYLGRYGEVVNNPTEGELRQGFVQKSEKVTINDINFCHGTGYDQGAGMLNIYENYLTMKNQECFLVSLEYGTSTCGGYDESVPEGVAAKKQCEIDNEKAMDILEQTISTFKFVK